MARFQIRRHFPSHQVHKVGQIVTDPQWRNLTFLVNQGYVKEVPDETDAVTPQEVVEVVEVKTEIPIAAKPKAAKPKKSKEKK